jgi:hypothetical protein
VTLYRISHGCVEVLKEGKWVLLSIDAEQEVLIPELDPKEMGTDSEGNRYVVTSEPDDNGDYSITISGLQKSATAIAKEKGWWEDPVDVGTKIALVHSEASEALEEWRNPQVKLNETYYSPKKKPLGFPIELADIVIRVAELAEHLQIDLTRAIHVKQAYNRTRPFRHGGKRA